MNSAINVERCRRACQDSAAMAELVTHIRYIMVAFYFAEIDEQKLEYNEEEGTLSAPEPTSIVCPHCKEHTMYSAALLLPGAPFDKLCISDNCIQQAVLSVCAAIPPYDINKD